MKIIDRLNEDRINISFEVFPPKTDAGFANVQRATDEIAKLDPSYISVTYFMPQEILVQIICRLFSKSFCL